MWSGAWGRYVTTRCLKHIVWWSFFIVSWSCLWQLAEEGDGGGGVAPSPFRVAGVDQGLMSRGLSLTTMMRK